MMRAVLSKSLLKGLLNHAKIVGKDEFAIEYLEEGWRIRMCDPANVAMVEINVFRDSMEEYEVTDGTAYACVSLKKLSETVNILPDDVPVRITNENGIFRVDGGKFHANIREDGEFKPLKVPDVQGDVIFPLDTNAIVGMFSTSDVSDAVTFTVNAEGLTVSAIGDTLEGMEYKDPDITYTDSPEGVKAQFPLGYVITAFKGLKGETLIELRTDFPLKIVINQPFVTKYLLAPRIESEE